MDSPHWQFAKDSLLAEYSFFGQMGVEQVRVSSSVNCPCVKSPWLPIVKATGRLEMSTYDMYQ